jgi:hypothetical protein
MIDLVSILLCNTANRILGYMVYDMEVRLHFVLEGERMRLLYPAN